MSARQCLKRVHLEIHRPELAQLTAQTRAAFAIGHRVGEIARAIYADGQSVLIPYEGGLSHALRKSARLLSDGNALPIFEATFAFGGVLVRLDALLPDGDSWRIVEVKASTTLKDEYLFDCAVQAWVFRSLGYPLSGIAVAHVDNTFVYPGRGDYRGLLTEIDVTEAVRKLLPGVPEWLRTTRDAIRGAEPRVPVGAQCNTPYDCPFMRYCWPAGPFAVQTLPRMSKGKLGRLIESGHTDLRTVPADELSETQRWVQRVCCSGEAEVLPGAREFAAGLGYPRYYLDFETIAAAVPLWPGTRPYEVLPFQWSCHYEPSAGQIQHAEFLDLSGEPPMRRVAESLIRVLGSDGPVLMYSVHERVVIEGLRQRFGDLDTLLGAVIDRLVDLQAVVQRNYYHPGMAGSWSLKAVLPTIAGDISYSELVGIQEGIGASEGYLEATDAVTSGSRKAEIRQQLSRYCGADTAAMVRLMQFLSAT
jgi:hypothetical protein